MPSPFPGMDPYIEGQRWRDFHARLLVYIGRALAPLIAPNYVAEIEEDIPIEAEPNGEPVVRVPDVRLLATRAGGSPGGVALAPPRPEPIRARLEEPLRKRRIEIRLRANGRLVTVIEVLSPDNKRAFSRGQLRYCDKREAFMASRVHLVELDLLRGGGHLALADPIPESDYLILVSREEARPDCAVQLFNLRDPLPVFPVPLLRDHGDVSLDLGKIFNELYDESGYAWSLDYSREPVPPLKPEDQLWARGLLSAVRAG